MFNVYIKQWVKSLLLSIALLIPSFALVLTALCVIGSSAEISFPVTQNNEVIRL